MGDLSIGQASGFGEAISGGAGQDHGDGAEKVTTMAHADIDGLDSGLGPEHRSDDFVAAFEFGKSAPVGWRFFGLAAEAALGTADGRQITEHAQVRGQPEPAWVGQTLAVAEEQLGWLP
jgi:hypothetical protein